MYTPTEAQKELYVIAVRAGDRITRAIQTYTKEMVRWLEAQYGETPPTYEQFWSDREALAILARENGLVDDQWVRKPYNAAVKALYQELPVSPSKAAVAKRLTRGSQNPTGERRHRPPKDPVKTVENAMHRMIESYGYAPVLSAMARILAERDETRREAKRVENLAGRIHNVDPALDTQPSMH